MLEATRAATKTADPNPEPEPGAATEPPSPTTGQQHPPTPAPPEPAAGENYNSIFTTLAENGDITPGKRAESLIQAQRSAVAAAATPAGKQAVLEDARRYLALGRAEWAAMLQTAAENADAAAAAKRNTHSAAKKTAPAKKKVNRRLPQDSFPQRMAKVREAANLVNKWETYFQQAQLRAGGAYQSGTCNPCRHQPHPGHTCQCGCAHYTEPTTGQNDAWNAWVSLNDAKKQWDERIEEARTPQPGDRFKVVGGKTETQGVAGRLIRTHPGKWGDPRALILPDGGGEQIWVSVRHITRDTPGFEPGVGDPILDSDK